MCIRDSITRALESSDISPSQQKSLVKSVLTFFFKSAKDKIQYECEENVAKEYSGKTFFLTFWQRRNIYLFFKKEVGKARFLNTITHSKLI